ncbi:MAG: hypothetical protein KDD33_13115, partial [Bdellovibrionales bacterium]|nr:hypothetical protein [Bdellovibrionales bacterium]
MNIFKVFITFMFFSTSALAGDVVFSPGKDSSPNVEQIRVTFPESMEKMDAPFEVSCDPQIGGFGSWADNNTTWVYNLDLPKDDWGDVRPLPGGASCQVAQVKALQSASGKIYKVSTLNYAFTVKGPNVQEVYLSPGYNELREENPVLMVIFDGDVDAGTLYNSQDSFLWYELGQNLPAEKILLAPVPQDQMKALFDVFAERYYFEYRGVKPESKNWAFFTVDRKLVPGAKLGLQIANVISSYASQAPSVAMQKSLKVRDNFEVKVTCARVEENSPVCMPEGGITVAFNSDVMWEDAKSAYLEYVPQNSTDGKAVQLFPSQESAMQSWLNWIDATLSGQSVDDILLKNLNFGNVKIAPQTVATVIFPSSLKDVDGRQLSIDKYSLDYGSFSEVIKMPSQFIIMEKYLKGNNGLPIGVMNLNQKISIKKSSLGSSSWEPTVKARQVIDLITSYDNIYKFNDNGYTSPMDVLGLDSSVEDIELMGQQNKMSLLTIPFAQKSGANKSGLYVVEVKSELSPSEDVPKYSLVMVTDLNLHIKKGADQSMVWVTSLASGLPVANAEVSIFDCSKAPVVKGKTNPQGLFSFDNSKVKTACAQSWGLQASNSYFAVATYGDDFSITHSTYNANSSWAMGAPGVEYFYSDVNDSMVYIHSVVGVNLVKPGQTVPVQLTATLPNESGFRAVADKDLPETAKVRFNGEAEVEYEFALNWKNGVAEFEWKVPKSTQLGSYSVVLTLPGRSWSDTVGTDIEVSEFKVPIMSSAVSLQKGPLVQPKNLKVSGLIKYANGVGAKDQEVDISYYFSPASLSVKDFSSFSFVKGEFDQEQKAQKLGLPTNEQVGQIAGLKTGSQGELSIDIGAEATASGANVIDTLSAAQRPYELVVRMRYKDQ